MNCHYVTAKHAKINEIHVLMLIITRDMWLIYISIKIEHVNLVAIFGSIVMPFLYR